MGRQHGDIYEYDEEAGRTRKNARWCVYLRGAIKLALGHSVMFSDREVNRTRSPRSTARRYWHAWSCSGGNYTGCVGHTIRRG